MDFVKNGTSYHFEFDIDKICKKELEYPDFNFFNMISEAGDNFKLSTIVMLCEFIGSDYKTMVANKFSIKDISEILSGCMEEIGFFLEE